MKYIDKNLRYINPKAYDEKIFLKPNPVESYLYHCWRDFLIKEIKENSKAKVVADFGCGTCEYTQFAKEAKKIYAIDISKEMLDYGKEKMEKAGIFNVNFLLESALNTSLKNNSINTIICFGLLEYINPELLIKEISRTLKNQGNLLLLFPNKYNPHHLLLQFYNRFKKEKRKKERSFWETKNLLEKYGFEIKKMESRGIIFYLPTKLQKISIFFSKILDFFYKPFQKIFPLGSNIYILAKKL
jgi:ubiquinone/menaquinone biosynthesis C-methylase UbiE